jgi:hypothetical protein
VGIIHSLVSLQSADINHVRNMWRSVWYYPRHLTWCLNKRPKAVNEWFTILVRVPEVMGSNLGLETVYPDQGFSWFSSVPSYECRQSTLKSSHDRFLPNLFKSIIHLSTLLHLTLHSLSWLWRGEIMSQNCGH